MCAHEPRHKLFLTLTNKNKNKKSNETKQTSRIIFDRPVISQNSKVALMYANKLTPNSRLFGNRSVSLWVNGPPALPHSAFFSHILQSHMSVEQPRTRMTIFILFCRWYIPSVQLWTINTHSLALGPLIVLFLTPYRSISLVPSFATFHLLEWFCRKTSPVLLITSYHIPYKLFSKCSIKMNWL